MTAHPRDDGAEDWTAALHRLVRQLAPDGKVKCYRQTTAREHYVCTLHIDETYLDGAEELLARALGGGAFRLRGYLGRRFVGTARFSADLGLHPLRRSEAELRRTAPGRRP